MHDLILLGLEHALTPTNLLAMTFGVALGMVVGAIPGLSGGTTMTVMLPLVLLAPPDTGVLFLMSIWAAAVYGGSISAICLNIPGTAAAAATTLDGFKLAQKGLVRRALRASIVGSAIGGLASAVALLFLSPPLADLALSFGPAELFAFALFGMATVTALSSGSFLRSLIATLLGIAVATIGIAPTGSPRLVLMPELMTGIPIIPLLIGLFTVPAALEMIAASRGSIAVDLKTMSAPETLFLKLSDWSRHGVNLARSAVIGVIVGVLPGAGPTIASFISYGAAKRSSRHPEEFGKGTVEGVIAPETANNGAVYAELVPSLAIGIPGSVDAVIILAALTIHGLVPGPLLISRSADVAYTVFVGAFIINIIMLLFGLGAARYLAYITKVRQSLLAPVILVFAFMGAFSVHSSVFEALLALWVGAGAFLLRRLDIPLAPVILAAILGPMLETYLIQALVLYGGPIGALTTRPVATILIAFALLSMLVPLFRPHWERYRGRFASPQTTPSPSEE